MLFTYIYHSMIHFDCVSRVLKGISSSLRFLFGVNSRYFDHFTIVSHKPDCIIHITHHIDSSLRSFFCSQFKTDHLFLFQSSLKQHQVRSILIGRKKTTFLFRIILFLFHESDLVFMSSSASSIVWASGLL